MTERNPFAQLRFAGLMAVMTLVFAWSAQAVCAAADTPAVAKPQPADAKPQPADAKPQPADAAPPPPSNGVKAFDAAGVRPVTFLSSLFSTGVFVLTLPFAALDPAMDVSKTRETLVDYPYGYTFRRPLGDLDDTEPPFAGSHSYSWE